MAKQPINIAVSAHTAVFFPLRVVEKKEYYKLFDDNVHINFIFPNDEEIKNYNGDTDQWVYDKVNDDNSEVIYGICDPIKCYVYYKNYKEGLNASKEENKEPNVKVIAALITKATFWAVSNNDVVKNPSGASAFNEIIAYPVGMTGFRFYELTLDAIKTIDESKNTPKHKPCNPTGGDFEMLQNNPYQTLLITPDIFIAKELCKFKKSIFNINYSYATQDYGEYFLTGLIAKNDVTLNTYNRSKKIGDKLKELKIDGNELTKNLVCSIQKSHLHIRKHPDFAITALLEWLGIEEPDKTEEKVAKDVITELLTASVYPEHLTVTISMWSDAIHHLERQKDKKFQMSDEDIKESFDNNVETNFSLTAFDSTVLEVIDFNGDFTKIKSWTGWKNFIREEAYPVLTAIYFVLVLILDWSNKYNLAIIFPYLLIVPIIIVVLQDKVSLTPTAKWIAGLVPAISIISNIINYFKPFISLSFNSSTFINLQYSQLGDFIFPIICFILFILFKILYFPFIVKSYKSLNP